MPSEAFSRVSVRACISARGLQRGPVSSRSSLGVRASSLEGRTPDARNSARHGCASLGARAPFLPVFAFALARARPSTHKPFCREH